MNNKESLAVLKILQVSYPHYYKHLTKEQLKDTVSFWATMFDEEPLNLVLEALKAVIVVSKFPPTIAEIKEKINILTKNFDSERTELEAWNQVLRAIKCSNYNSVRCFEEFDDILKRLVGSANQLREWAVMDIEKLSTVVQSNFMRSYKAVVAKNDEIKKLPKSGLALLEQKEKNKLLSNNN